MGSEKEADWGRIHKEKRKGWGMGWRDAMRAQRSKGIWKMEGSRIRYQQKSRVERRWRLVHWQYLYQLELAWATRTSHPKVPLPYGVPYLTLGASDDCSPLSRLLDQLESIFVWKYTRLYQLLLPLSISYGLWYSLLQCSYLRLFIGPSQFIFLFHLEGKVDKYAKYSEPDALR